MLQQASIRRSLWASALALFFLALNFQFPPISARLAASPDIVISQIYGAGGNSGATWRNDFIELFNRGPAAVNLSGWSIQYASSTGTTWQKTDLTGSLQPGQYLLIQQASGGTNGAVLPTPDVTGTIAMAATAGKVALLNSATLIASGTACPSGASLVDLVGYGSGTNCFEGSNPTPAPSATNAVFRAASGCTDNDNNATDFSAAAANPRNIASPLAPCSTSTPPTGNASAAPNPVLTGAGALLTVTVAPGANPPSTGITVRGDLTGIGGAANQTFFDNGTNGDATANDNIFSFQAAIPANLTPGLKVLPITLADAQSRTSSTNISLQVRAPIVAGDIVISQVYGGGGNSGAPFTNDFIEIFNRSNQPVDITGWSVQYAAATSGTWQKTDLTGTLQPGQYFLIQQDSGGANGAPLPTPNVTGTLSLAATAGKVALLNNAALIANGTGCPSGGGLVDFVGYGNTATCFEGAAPAPAPSATNAIRRAGNGCGDTNNNTANFATGAPLPRNSATGFNVCGSGAIFDNNNAMLAVQELSNCTGIGDVLLVEANLTNVGTRNQLDNPGSEFIAKLTPALAFVPDSCVTIGTGTCTLTNAGQLDWNGVVPLGETVTLRFQIQVKEAAATDPLLCLNATINYDSDNDGLNNATLTASQCQQANCQPVAAGQLFPAKAEASDQRAGSVLVFPFYSSDPAALNRENTRISLTNLHPQRRATVHLFFIADDTTGVADGYLCLTPNQTVSFLMSDLDPDVAGYLIAVASDERLGCPVNFNYLVGDEFVKLAAGHAANLPAIAFAALGAVPCDEQASTAELKFDGVQYNATPRTLALDNLPSPADGNATLLILDRLSGNLATGLNTLGSITGVLYNDAEAPYSFEFSTTRRQFRAVINASFPRTAPRVPTIIPAGRSGWLKLARGSDGAFVGAALNFNPNSGTNSNAFNQGHNLHHLTLTTESSLIVPVFPPTC
ncbi:MAG: lamin tail domain-containing protein [Acidobacteria bacterium]|nr:lamin tail domain-containing protein [Acidobacteriota bacterium]MBI3424009.1 lamin tail domain-containing protein [Acidobacteriota bacterium]